MEFLSLLIGTVILRPYVFLFLALYLVVASQQIGWKRTLLWTITGYAVAFAAEFSSIHGGFPFGDYYYVDATRNQELWIAGVPFMHSLSFAFLTFTGYTCAWQLVAAWKGKNGRLDNLEYVFDEDASEEDFPADRVVPHRVFRIVLDHGSFFENLCLKHEIDMDRSFENLRRKEGIHAPSD